MGSGVVWFLLETAPNPNRFTHPVKTKVWAVALVCGLPPKWDLLLTHIFLSLDI